MAVLLPGHLVVVLTSVSADVAEVRAQLSSAAADPGRLGRDALTEKARQLAAIERAIGEALADQ